MACSIRGIVVALLTLACLAPRELPAQVNSTTPGWFPFVFPGFDARPTAVDMSYLNIKPAGRDGFLRMQDGVIRDGAGRRVRWFGVNFVGDSCFPEKSSAPLIAARLAKLGVNIVRLHFMDTYSNWRASLIPYPANTGLRADTLDRLDTLVAELKKQGIYVNLNLHVGRTYAGNPTDSLFQFSKMLDHFYPPFITAFQQFTRDLLTHRNPYTGNSYAQEPAVGCIEVNNENTLGYYFPAQLSRLPEPFLGELKRQWMTWLRAKYGTTEGLRAAWGVTDGPLGPNLVANPDFTNKAQGWTLYNAGPAQSSLGPIPDGTLGARWHITRIGTEIWHEQIWTTGLTLLEGEPYRLNFRARADAERTFLVDVKQEQVALTRGLSVQPKLTRGWQEFSYTFGPQGTRPNLIRISFDARNQLGFIDLAAVALQKLPGILLPNETFENNNIPFPTNSPKLTARRDLTAFLIDTEHTHAQEMHRFIQKELGARQIIYHGQTLYGGMAGAVRERKASDLVDTHGYWQHPEFPGTNWDPVNWHIPNTPQLADAGGGVLTRMALERVQGMPFTVSEYNTAAPSDYAAETWPLLATMAAFQDWDGIYAFDYQAWTATDFNLDRIGPGWFESQAHPAHQAFLPLAALLFRTEMVRPAVQAVVLTAPEERILDDQMRSTSVGSFDRFWQQVSLSRPVALRHRTALNLIPGDGPTSVSFRPTLSTSGPITSDTGETVWDAGQRTMAVNAPGVRLLLGKVGGQTVAVGDVRFQVGAMGGNEHAYLGLIALDGRPITTSTRLLLAAIGRAENQNMGWNATRTSVGDRWGIGPVVAQGVTATVTLPQGVWTVAALDPTGEPKRTVASNVSAVTISPADQTVWYLLSR